MKISEISIRIQGNDLIWLVFFKVEGPRFHGTLLTVQTSHQDPLHHLPRFFPCEFGTLNLHVPFFAPNLLLNHCKTTGNIPKLKYIVYQLTLSRNDQSKKTKRASVQLVSDGTWLGPSKPQRDWDRSMCSTMWLVKRVWGILRAANGTWFPPGMYETL